MKKNSVVWRFFDRVEAKGRCNAVICKLCEVQYRFFGNTTNLRVHLSRKHPIQWELAHDDPTVRFTEEVLDFDSSTSSAQKGTHKNKVKIIMPEDENEVMENMRNHDEEWLEDLYENIDCVRKEPNKPIKIKRRIKREVDDDALYYQVESPELDDTNTEPQDEYEAFGKYVACKIRKLSSERTRGNIQQIITTVLWQAEYGTYDNAESVKNILFSYVPNVNISMNPAEISVPDDAIQVEMADNNETEVFMR